ncbi:MAG: hypothetical protein ACFFFT_14235 [Candidatus Thorarchaeota archaeon]
MKVTDVSVRFSFFWLSDKNQVDIEFFHIRNFQNGRIEGNEKITLSKQASFCEIDYYKDTFSYPSFFTIEISSPGRLNSIAWIQELWYR